MDPELIATLVAQALSLALTIYQQYSAAQQSAGLPAKSIEEFLMEADANFAAIPSTAQGEIAATATSE